MSSYTTYYSKSVEETSSFSSKNLSNLSLAIPSAQIGFTIGGLFGGPVGAMFGLAGGTVVGLVGGVAARRHRNSPDANVYDKEKPVFFMDVGVWAGGPDGKPQTSFGLISGRDVFLCSWMNKCEGGKPFSEILTAKFEKGLSSGARNFFEMKPELKRRFILAHARLPHRLGLLIPENEVIIVIPDLHLHLQAGGPLDQFMYKDEKGEKQSLDGQLRALIDLKKDLKSRKITMRTVQVGDMYDVWFAECILRHRLKQLKELICDSQRYHSSQRKDFLHMLEEHLVPKELLDNESGWIGMDWYYQREWDHERIKKECIDVSSTKDIVNHIQKAHAALFLGNKKIFNTELRGNHDNFFPNQFFCDQESAPKDYYKFSELRFITSDDCENEKLRKYQTGENNCIWMEHGHYWDIDNNDYDWWTKRGKMGNGFNVVHTMIRGWGDRWFSTGSDADMVQLANDVADLWTDLKSKEMRLFITLRADQVFKENPSVRLFIAGHTHSPCLVENPKDFSLFWQHPDAGNYFNSNEIMKEAKKFAAELLPHNDAATIPVPVPCPAPL